jgi:hypothetical protein
MNGIRQLIGKHLKNISSGVFLWVLLQSINEIV